MAKDAESILQRDADLIQELRLVLPRMQELADYIQPRKSNIMMQSSPGQSKTDFMFDSTAPHANGLLAASMQGALTSAAFRWHTLRIRGIELKRDHQVSMDLEECANDMFDSYNQSNFASENHEVYLDAPCFGIAAMLVEERPASRVVPHGSLRFTAFAPGSYAIDEDDEGYVDTVFQHFKLSARAAATKYGAQNLGKQINAALTQNPSQRFEFIRAVYPRTDQSLPMGKKALPSTKMAVACMIVDIEGRVVVNESGYHEKSIVVPRWTKTTGEMYGYGCGDIALPDIKSLNMGRELGLKAWAKAVDPSLMARDEGIIGGGKNIQLQNGGVTYVRDMESIKPLHELAGNLQVADLEEGKIREAIRRMFYSDQLQLQEGPQMTAYEVQVRYELMQRILGPTLGRLNVEFLNPIIERVFWIRLRASEKNSPYRRLEAWCAKNGKPLDIEYEGPLAKAQRLQESVALQRFFQIALPISQVKPEVLDKIDFDAVIDVHADSVGIPTRVIRDEAFIKTVREARTKAQEEQSKLENAAVAAKAGGDVAPLLTAIGQQKDGSLPIGAGPQLGSG